MDQRVIASAHCAGNVEFKDVLYGNVAPLTLQLKDLNGDWRCMTMTGSSELSGMMGMVSSMFGGGSWPYMSSISPHVLALR